MKEPMPISQIPYGALTAQPLALVADSAGLNWIYDAAPDSMFSKIFSLEKAELEDGIQRRLRLLMNDMWVIFRKNHTLVKEKLR